MCNTAFLFMLSGALISTYLTLNGDKPAPANQPATKPSAPCELTIDLDKPIYQQDEPVRLTLITRNHPPHRTAFSHPETAPTLVVTIDGRPVEYTRFGKTAIEMMKHHMGSNHGAVMKDDESRSEPFLLSRWVDLTLSGKYEVVVSRRVADAPENEFKYRVESNRLTFEIRD